MEISFDLFDFYAIFIGKRGVVDKLWKSVLFLPIANFLISSLHNNK